MKFKGKKLLAMAMAAAMTVSGVSWMNQMGKVETNAATTRVGDEKWKEIPGTTSSFDDYNTSFLSVTGYAQAGVHDRSKDLNTSKHRQVKTVAEFLQAVRDAKRGSKMVSGEAATPVSQGSVTVIEVMNDLDFATILSEYSDVQSQEGLKGSAQLIQKGNFKLSAINMDDINGLTIFSKNGSTLRHCSFTIGSGGDAAFGSNDIVVRNLRFDGMWMWDNSAKQKDAGWSFMKIQQSTNVWIDHCSFTIAFDGNIDLENGAHGVTLSWCRFGMTAEEAKQEGSTVQTSIQYMEDIWSKRRGPGEQADALKAEIEKVKAAGFQVKENGAMSEEELTKLQTANPDLYTSYTKALSRYQSVRPQIDLNGGTIYGDMRFAGVTPEEIMGYAAYHSKTHLVGDGDHLYKDYEKEVGGDPVNGLSYEEFANQKPEERTYNEDCNGRLQLTMAYDWYQNVGQRVPLIRMGTGHLYNCYIDDMDHINTTKNENIKKASQASQENTDKNKRWSPFTMTRCINARDGATIGADTCVFYGVNEPLVGADVQGDDIGNLNAPWDSLYATAVNHALIVNSRTTDTSGNNYEGSSRDNKGSNQFSKGYKQTEKLLDSWCWKNSITHLGDTPVEETNRNLMHCSTTDVNGFKNGNPVFIWHKGRENEKTFTLSYLEKLLDENGNPKKNDNENVMYKPFKWACDEDATLPYAYQLVQLDDVKEVVTSHSGAGSVKFQDGSSWVRTVYEKGEDIFEKEEVKSPEPISSEETKQSEEPASSEETKQSAEPVPSEEVKESAEPAPSEEVKESAEPVPSEEVKESAEPAPSEEVKESAEPASSEEVKESAGPVPSEAVKESAGPVQSEEPKVSPNPSGTPEFMIGDVDGDKEIKLKDAQLALKAALNLIKLDDAQTKAADVDGNGKIELKDAQKILKVALNLDTFTGAKTASVKVDVKNAKIKLAKMLGIF